MVSVARDLQASSRGGNIAVASGVDAAACGGRVTIRWS